MIRNSDAAYGRIAKGFHWLIALVILGLLTVGFYMDGLESSPFRIQLYGLHKSFGILVLVLAALRLIWRVTNRQPDHLTTHARWERILAGWTHFLLYAAIFLMPLSGWVMSSAGGFPAGFFGLFELPPLMEKNQEIFRLMRGVHFYLAMTIIGLVALHVAGALKHHFIDRDITLKRMTYSGLGLIGGILIAVLAAAALIIPLYVYIMYEIGERKEENVVKAEGEIQKAGEETAESRAAETDEGQETLNLDRWAILPEASFVGFEATQNGQPFTGRFPDLSGRITFDPENLEQSHADIQIDITSIDTGSTERDEQARTDEWFDTDEYPKAIFQSESFEPTGPNRYEVQGHLTIKDQKIPVRFPFTLNINKILDGGEKAVMEARTELNRSDFNVGTGQWESHETIGNPVKISLHVEAEKF